MPDYIGRLPVDPHFADDNNRGYRYGVNEAGTAFKLMTHDTIESGRTFDNLDEFARCPSVCADAQHSGTGWCSNNSQMGGDADWTQPRTLAVYSLGAECW